MDKLLISLHVPALNEKFDLFVPAELAIVDLTPVIAKGVAGISNGRYIVTGMELLSGKDDQILFDPHKTLADYSVPDGAELMLL